MKDIVKKLCFGKVMIIEQWVSRGPLQFIFYIYFFVLFVIYMYI